MSIQAVGWALEQDLPARPKLVLVSLCNHADHRTGYCWLKAETIADEASCSPRAVFNFIGDLIRNGYVRKAARRGDDGKQRANDYWILFDREAVKWTSDRSAGRDADAEDTTEIDAAEDDPPQDVVPPHAPGAVGEEAPPTAPEPVDMRAGAVGPHAPACSHTDPAEPSKTNPKSAREGFGAPPRSYRPPPPPQPVAQGAIVGSTERIFVIRGTPAWDAWMVERKRKTGIGSAPTTRHVVNGSMREGWFFPTLFPPDATGPPKATELTDDEAKAFTGE
jgi:hypothetical protein